MRWLRSLGYVLIACTSWALTAYAWYQLLALLKPSRQLTFFVSMGLVLAVLWCGLYFEDRLIWKGYFDGRYKRWEVLAGGRRTAPPPITVGVMSGLLIFFLWR